MFFSVTGEGGREGAEGGGEGGGAQETLVGCVVEGIAMMIIFPESWAS